MVCLFCCMRFLAFHIKCVAERITNIGMLLCGFDEGNEMLKNAGGTQNKNWIASFSRTLTIITPLFAYVQSHYEAGK
jgi:hypothetical protein